MNPVTRAWRVGRKQGLRVVVQKAATRILGLGVTRVLPVRRSDVMAVDWRTPHPSIAHPRPLGEGPLVVAWIMSPPGLNSGGHQNIFRFIRFLEQAGHRARIYVDSNIAGDTIREVTERVASSASYDRLDAPITAYPASGIPADVDVIVATGWETAYRSWTDASDAKRVYFVQDFEPSFYPSSSESVLAENTYRFGFPGITAGGWLAARLSADYGMPTEAFDFGADPRHYPRTENGRRDGVFFYARPETPRRGYELGEMALELLLTERPRTEVHLAGQNLGLGRPRFPHTSHGTMPISELGALYNRCAAGLVLSLTNMSLLPLELLSAGVIPVVNDAPNNRMVSDNPFIRFAEPTPRALADQLRDILDASDQQQLSLRGSASVQNVSWEQSGAQFLGAFERAIHG